MYFTVYKTTNLINKMFYIGAHKTKYLDDDYIGSGKYFWRAVEKYGIENFKKEILACFNNAKEMFSLETELVAKEKGNPLCYNLNNGGEGGWEWVTEHNRFNRTLGGQRANVKLLIWLTDKNNRERQLVGFKRVNNGSDEHKQRCRRNISFAGRKWIGMHHKQETRKQMSEKKQGSKNNRFGTCWIYNLIEKKSKSIFKSELELYISKGWQVGRKIKF